MDNIETPRLKLYAEDAQAIDDLFRQALSKKGPAALTQMCQFIQRFRRFSVFNAMLIQVQRPGAQAVGSRSQWRRIGRTVNPDAVPVVVLMPFGPIEFAYEYGDTVGRDIPVGEDDPFGAYGQLDDRSWERTARAGAKVGILVELVNNYGSGLAGTASTLRPPPHDHAETSALSELGNRWRVRVNGALKPAAQYATLAHELAHIYCGHLGGGPRDQWPDRNGSLSESQRELEAEAAAYMVCARAGIETRSADYLALHVKEGDLDAISVFAVLSAANRIEARSDRNAGRR